MRHASESPDVTVALYGTLVVSWSDRCATPYHGVTLRRFASAATTHVEAIVVLDRFAGALDKTRHQRRQHRRYVLVTVTRLTKVVDQASGGTWLMALALALMKVPR